MQFDNLQHIISVTSIVNSNDWHNNPDKTTLVTHLFSVQKVNNKKLRCDKKFMCITDNIIE